MRRDGPLGDALNEAIHDLVIALDLANEKQDPRERRAVWDCAACLWVAWSRVVVEELDEVEPDTLMNYLIADDLGVQWCRLWLAMMNGDHLSDEMVDSYSISFRGAAALEGAT